MASSRAHSHMVSPVRGQLEPWRSGDRTGWRFIQCTDTFDEFKVLLPPRTAFLYQHLLNAETQELSKGDHTSWEKIIHMRQLKDRLIRKCYRLVDRDGRHRLDSTPTFQTVYAPPDFRCRQLERWLRDQGGELSESLKAAPPKQAKTGAEKAGHPTRAGPGSEDDNILYGSRIMRESFGGSPRQLPRSRSTSQIFRPPTIIPLDASSSLRRDFTLADDQRTSMVASPEPLPLPFRPRPSSVPPETRSPPDAQPQPPGIFDSPGSPVNSAADIAAALAGVGVTHSPDMRPELRRRSSLRSGMGFDGPSKSVAWSMDRGALTNLTNKTAQSRDIGTELQHLRAICEDETSRVRTIKQNISERLAALLAETVKLQMEEASLRVHEQRLVDSQARLKELELEYAQPGGPTLSTNLPPVLGG